MTSGQGCKADVKRKEVRKLPNITALYQDLQQYIIGQNEALKKVALSIYRNVDFQIKSNVLIIGQSGSGKTETLRQVCNLLDLPYTMEDATKYTQEGYIGSSVEEMIYNLYSNSGYDLEATKKGMLIIDEIDKKADTGREKAEVSRGAVLNSLLKIMEGTIIPIKEKGYIYEYVNTRKMIVIFMGAFEGLEKIREKRIGTKQIGFKTSFDDKNTEKDNRYTKEDLIKYGLPAEFVGRIDTIIEYKQLSKRDLVNILKRSRLSIFKAYEKQFRRKGIILKYNPRIFEQIAQKALNQKTGARELANIVNEMFEHITFDVLSAEPRTYKECLLKNDIVTNPRAYELK